MIFIDDGGTVTLVYDLDTRLPFACSFETYVSEALLEDDWLKPEFRRYFVEFFLYFCGSL